MKFLVDHQLPAALAWFIATQGHPAEHARDLGLMEAFRAQLPRIVSELEAGNQIVELR